MNQPADAGEVGRRGRRAEKEAARRKAERLVVGEAERAEGRVEGRVEGVEGGDEPFGKLERKVKKAR